MTSSIFVSMNWIKLRVHLSVLTFAIYLHWPSSIRCSIHILHFYSVWRWEWRLEIVSCSWHLLEWRISLIVIIRLIGLLRNMATDSQIKQELMRLSWRSRCTKLQVREALKKKTAYFRNCSKFHQTPHPLG